MKNSFVLICIICFAMIVTGLSCSKKSSTTPPTNLATTLKFTAGGKTYQWNGSRATTGNEGSIIYKPGAGSNWFSLLSIQSSTGVNGFGFSFLGLRMLTTTLSATTYAEANTGIITFMNHLDLNDVGKSYTSSETGDFTSITITSIHDGDYVDGIFSAKMTEHINGPTSNKLYITNGEFRNVKIF
jgi:hypothetical protein